jgi:hypothetical protein
MTYWEKDQQSLVNPTDERKKGLNEEKNSKMGHMVYGHGDVLVGDYT